MWDNLVALLAEMLELYKALLQVSENKRGILVSANATELEAVTKQEETLILQIGKIEAKREAVIRDLVNVYGLKTQDANLNKLTEFADQQTAETLKDSYREFEKVMKKLTAVNEDNTRLIEQALHIINYNINLLAQNSAGPTYAPRGQQDKNSSNTRTIFDTRV